MGSVKRTEEKETSSRYFSRDTKSHVAHNKDLGSQDL